MEMLFDLDNPECRALKSEIGAAVNTAIEAAIRAGMTAADTNVKISSKMVSSNGMLVPTMNYKTTIKIGESYENGKGSLTGSIGMLRDKDGYWHTKYADQQLSMVE